LGRHQGRLQRPNTMAEDHDVIDPCGFCRRIRYGPTRMGKVRLGSKQLPTLDRWSVWQSARGSSSASLLSNCARKTWRGDHILREPGASSMMGRPASHGPYPSVGHSHRNAECRLAVLTRCSSRISGRGSTTAHRIPPEIAEAWRAAATPRILPAAAAHGQWQSFPSHAPIHRRGFASAQIFKARTWAVRRQ